MLGMTKKALNELHTMHSSGGLWKTTGSIASSFRLLYHVTGVKPGQHLGPRGECILETGLSSRAERFGKIIFLQLFRPILRLRFSMRFQ